MISAFQASRFGLAMVKLLHQSAQGEIGFATLRAKAACGPSDADLAAMIAALDVLPAQAKALMKASKSSVKTALGGCR